jgi:chlorobactene glucosyltransferase
LIPAASLLAAAVSVPLAAMLGIALHNLRRAPRLADAPQPRAMPRVSLLVPARDEAANLARTLPLLLRSTYPALEVCVLDDESHDTTADVVARLAAADDRLRLLRGAPLPQGWAGKNWACAQLARAATGEILIFCDADVDATDGAVTDTVGSMQRWRADVLTALPKQHLTGWLQHAVVPLVTQVPVLLLLPLRLVPRSAHPSIGMANGQWLAFTRDAYERVGGHAAVASSALEDVDLARRVKRSGLRLLVTLAADSLTVRMYPDSHTMRQGFTKNLYLLLGGRPAPFVAGLALVSLITLVPLGLAATGRPIALVPLALLAGARAAAARAQRHGWRGVLFHPAGATAVVGLALESALRAHRGGVRWRGRQIEAKRRGSVQAPAP